MGTVAQVISNLIDHHLGIQAAVGAPMVDASEPEVRIDERLPERTRADLARRGHQLVVARPRAGAGAAGIVIDPATGGLRGGDEPTGEGVALGM